MTNTTSASAKTAKAAAKPKLPASPEASFSKLTGDDESSTATEKDQALASLELQLQAEKDARLEERFVWLVISVILLDIIWFHESDNATLPIVVLILELVALMVIARRMQVDDFVNLVGGVLHGFGKRGGG